MQDRIVNGIVIQTGVSSKEAVVKGKKEMENLFGITAELQFTDRRKAKATLLNAILYGTFIVEDGEVINVSLMSFFNVGKFDVLSLNRVTFVLVVWQSCSMLNGCCSASITILRAA